MYRHICNDNRYYIYIHICIYIYIDTLIYTWLQFLFIEL